MLISRDNNYYFGSLCLLISGAVLASAVSEEGKDLTDILSLVNDHRRCGSSYDLCWKFIFTTVLFFSVLASPCLHLLESLNRY